MAQNNLKLRHEIKKVRRKAAMELTPAGSFTALTLKAVALGEQVAPFFWSLPLRRVWTARRDGGQTVEITAIAIVPSLFSFFSVFVRVCVSSFCWLLSSCSNERTPPTARGLPVATRARQGAILQHGPSVSPVSLDTPGPHSLAGDSALETCLLKSPCRVKTFVAEITDGWILGNGIHFPKVHRFMTVPGRTSRTS